MFEHIFMSIMTLALLSVFLCIHRSTDDVDCITAAFVDANRNCAEHGGAQDRQRRQMFRVT